ncbi:DUF2865 domain-containing protein [Rhodopseudomonas palustris]|uniref:DUF2865 domain-containing protein n=1 Tax=Rhodopseudomonas palustris (strain BisB18) TaxID=316056 RepID=Q20Z86_RHOPB
MAKFRTAAMASCAGGLAALVIAGLVGPAHAENDFLSALFGAFNAPQRNYRPEPSMPMPFASEGGVVERQPTRRAAPRSRSSGGEGGGQAFCVRTCDGRYFPVNGADNRSRAETCNSFCPASETKVMYGSTIDNALAAGKSYSELPNAFKYRSEIVTGCTCNGKDQFGLAKVDIDDDPTLRKGDIVAAADGLMVAGRADRRHGALNFSPASGKIRARYERLPVVASD